MKHQQIDENHNIQKHHRMLHKASAKEEVLEISQDDLIDFSSHDQIKKKDIVQPQLIQYIKNFHYLQKDVPIYRIQSKYDSVTIQINQNNTSQYFAHGELIGKFYQSSELFYLQNISFVGNFEGMFQWQSNQQKYSPVYFEGNISQMRFITMKDQIFENKNLNQISFFQSSFHGYFKGHFYPWIVVGGIQNIQYDSLTFKDTTSIPLSFNYLTDASCNQRAKINSVSNDRVVEYNLPTLVCFQIKDIGNINLQKSSAVVNGNLIIQIKYNTYIDEVLTFYQKNRQKLSIALNFNRDITLFLPLQEQEDEEIDTDNQSQWSLQDKLWDIQLTKDKKNKILHYKIIKKLRAEIDNSYGGFFAPFNLNQLRIVIHFSSLNLQFNKQKIKVNFTCVDTFDYQDNNRYNPFLSFNSLSKSGLSPSQVNRYYKINRFYCTDNGEYIIADNRLALYPHYKSILKNKSIINNDVLWNFGIRNCLPFLQPTLASNIQNKFEELTKNYEKNEQQLRKGKFQTFSFLKWQNIIIQIPIYKYIAIDMLKILVPLTIVTILSLFIFNQENGIGQDNPFTTLAYRIANVAAIAITFSSMIPITLKSLPPMAGITLIEIIIYIQAIPSFLAIINSMIYYSISIEQWRRDYKAFNDAIFIFGFTISIINLILLISIFLIYKWTQYNTNQSLLQFQKSLIKWRSPLYLKFIQSVMTHKSDYYIIVEQNV